MRFLSLIKGAERSDPPPKELMDAMEKLIPDAMKSGTLVSTGGLARSAAGIRIRVSRGTLAVTDGPFAEAKEIIGGYAILETRTREEAIESTRQFMQLHLDHWPGWEGECELREIVGGPDVEP